MKNSDVDTAVVAAVVAELGQSFRTKDVSTDPRVVSAHSWASQGELNTAVGRILSRDRAQLGLILEDDRPNAIWAKT